MSRALVERLKDADSTESIGQLLSQLANNSANLVRDEIALARQEIDERVKLLSLRLVNVAAGVIAALFGVGALLAAAVIGLAKYIGPGFSCLAIGIVLLAVGFAVTIVSIHGLKQTSLKPVQTLETLEEDKEWLKQLT